MDLTQIGSDVVVRVLLAQDRDQWRAVVDKVIDH
jgi:hypothetical protein